VRPDGVDLIVDGRYAEAAASAIADLEDVALVRVPGGRSYEETLGQLLASRPVGSVGVEGTHLPVGRLRSIEGSLEAGQSVHWSETAGILETIRVRKDAWELEIPREAGRRVSDVAACILPKVAAGRTERQVAWEIAVALHEAGFERPAFDTIVASGPNGARPHHRADDRVLERGDLVVVDFGGVLDGYCVDMCRTVALEPVPAHRLGWMTAVAAAQSAAIRSVAPRRRPSEVDAEARAVLAAAGLADQFTHSTGHGLGLEVHEGPTIGPRGDASGPLAAGMVFTVEPGVYFPGEGGVRIEDDVLVTSTDVERLTQGPATYECS
jgi:Xaa-Pro aminopeptidase